MIRRLAFQIRCHLTPRNTPTSVRHVADWTVLDEFPTVVDKARIWLAMQDHIRQAGER